jgi:hypothetical protein
MSKKAPTKRLDAGHLGQPGEAQTAQRYSSYSRALGKALQEGAKYRDLLQIQPQDYGLPQTWQGCLASDKYSSVLWAIAAEYSINQSTSLNHGPGLRAIAQELEAPYSVIMDCYNLANRQTAAEQITK